MRVVVALICAGLIAGAVKGADNKPEWFQNLTSRRPPGNFTPPPAMRMVYRFGWSGFPAARAEIRFQVGHGVYQTDATGGTYGFPRTLFRFDVTHQSITDRATLRPLHLFQEERYRAETVRTTIDYKPDHLVALREVTPEKSPPKPNTFDLTPVFDMQSAALWLRSTPLQAGQKETLIVWPSNAPYLATVTVLGRESIRVAGEERPTIKLNLELKRIDKSLQLKEHKKFKSGRVWLSDDDLRVPLRVEADIFIGYVYAELESAQRE
jgi:Protein of unknown function (DUF3108)